MVLCITEDGESLEDAVLRELEEETGLVVTAAERQSNHILGLWESVFPPLLSLGHPKRHHVVVYIHMILERSSEELQNQFKVSFITSKSHYRVKIKIIIMP